MNNKSTAKSSLCLLSIVPMEKKSKFPVVKRRFIPIVSPGFGMTECN